MFHPTFHEYDLRGHIDTAIYVRKHLDLRLREFFEGMNMKLIQAHSYQDSGLLSEEYYFQYKVGTAQKGILCLAYSNEFNELPIQLSPFMDSIKGKKVNEYKILTFGRPVPKYTITIDTLLTGVKMERIREPPPKKVFDLIDLYTKASKMGVTK
ncbi:hypothetical protein [Sediminibacterium soli]|uniref:hypothetical protein n=1 Tax=Sediminibacterium soli TaxID=2698829 RepID=UPI00137A0E12|nr:hypothetical protein [Sediminibacterium soli]NCI47592.1 hypothetical protein [Sediminibacterium soli]